MWSHYRFQVTIGAEKWIDAEQDRVTIRAEWAINPICTEHQQSISVE